jgi:replicative DNA helicase
MNKLQIKYSNETPLPNNFLAEQAILNIILTKPSTFKTVSEKLKSESFYVESHQLIYESLLDLVLENRPINITSVVTKLETKGQLKQVGGIEKMSNIINRFESFVDLDDYIELVNEKYLRRLLIELGKQIIGWGYTTSTEVEQILEKTEQSIYNLSQERTTPKFYSSAEIVDDIFEEMKLKAKIKNSGLLSSFHELDSILQGFQKSDLIVIAGRPSMGKTAFSLNIGINVVKQYKIPLLIFSLEMSRQQIIYRLISTDSEINSNRLKSGKMNAWEWKLLSKSMKEISELPIFIDDDPNINISDIRSKIKKIIHENNKDCLVIIDYLQLMRVNKKFENRSQEISYVTRNLKILAREFKIPIVILSQLSRNLESRPNKRPMLSDLRDSGSIEQDADIVIMLYREDYYQEKKGEEQITEFIVAKHRNGPIGTAKLLFNPNYTNFKEQEQQQQQTNARNQI